MLIKKSRRKVNIRNTNIWMKEKWVRRYVHFVKNKSASKSGEDETQGLMKDLNTEVWKRSQCITPAQR